MKELADYDGKALSMLGELKARHGNDPNFTSTLIDLMAGVNEMIAGGATWLIKNMLETGNQLDRKQAKAFVDAMPQLNGWQAHLHACQSLQFLPREVLQEAELGLWLEKQCGSERPFIRAWAVDGLVRMHLAKPHSSELFEHATKALSSAQSDESASVRARARKLQKSLSAR